MSDALFTVGGTVQAAGGLYIPRAADRQLLELCRSGAFAYVLTPRQMGKSSLMIRTAEQLERDGARTLIIDLSQIGVGLTDEAWYLGLLTAIEERFELDTDVYQWWSEHKHLGTTHRLTKFFEQVLLQEIQERVVIFVDEIDTTLSLPFSDDFYAAIRYIYNARAVTLVFQRLSFVLIGVATPSDLIADPKRTPFNIGHRVDLTDFTLEEARPLEAGLELPAAEAEQVMQWILDWTGGHPYLTQRLCRAVAEQRRSAWTKEQIDELVAATFFGERSEQDNNLQFVRDMLTQRAGDRVGVLRTYLEILRNRHPVPDDEQSLVKTHLKLSGVADRRGGTLKVRNRVYSTVFDKRWTLSHWPETWVKRNSAMLLRAGVVVVLVLALFASSAAVVARKGHREALTQRASAMKNALEANLQRARAETAREEAIRQRTAAEDARRRIEGLLALTERQRSLAQDSARVAREKAERESRANTSRRLAILADAKLAEELDLAFLLALEAVRIDDNEQTRTVLQKAMEYVPALDALIGRRATDNDVMVGRLPFTEGPGQQLLLATVDSGNLVLWDVEARRVHAKFQARRQRYDDEIPISVSLSKDGRFIASNVNQSGEVWDVKTGNVVHTLIPQTADSGTAAVASLAFSPDNRVLAVAEVRRPAPGAATVTTIALLDVNTWTRLSTFTVPWSVVFNIAISPDSRLVAVGGGSELNTPNRGRTMHGGLTIFEVPTGRLVYQSSNVAGEVTFSVAFTPDSRWLVSASTKGSDKAEGGILRLWNASSGVLTDSLRTPRQLLLSADIEPKRAAVADSSERFMGVAAAADENGQGEVVAFTVEDGQLVQEDGVPIPLRMPISAAFSPDGKFIVVGMIDAPNLLLRIADDREGADTEQRVCRISNRNLTQEEWQQYVGPEIPYRKTCPQVNN